MRSGRLTPHDLMSYLRVGSGLALVPEALIESARGRCRFEGFIEPESRERPTFVLDVAPMSTSFQTEVTVATGTRVGITVEGDTILVSPPRDAYEAELGFRLVFHLDAVRKGGFLVHSSGVTIDGRAFVAFGQSGAGKSTFAAQCMKSPGVQVLSDEIVAVFPSGMCHGTPFRSDLDVASVSATAPIHQLLMLRKATEERLDPVNAVRAVAALVSQVYRSPIEPLSSSDILERASILASRVGISELSFRKTGDVAQFLRHVP